MGDKACINWIEPEGNTTVGVGETVKCRIAMYNCGNADGNFYVAIDDDVCADYNFWLEQYVERICSGSFVMPNRVVTLKYRGGHSEDSNWIQDFTKTITLTPKIVPCDQPVRVVDEDGIKIDSARVDCYQGSSFKGHCTTYYGDCLLSFLDPGTSYRARASKAGYECLNCEKSFTACTSRITLSLKKQATVCNQSFIVKDTSGNTVTKNCIIVVREGGAWKNECATSTSGTCAVGLIKCTPLRACVEQVPSGYELISDSCKNFTACTSRITLKIKKTCSCTSWQKGECISETHRRYTRICTPSGCDIEVEDRPDSTCAAPTCECGNWTDGECVSTTHRAQTRTCTPAGCDIEYQEVPDSTCETAPPPPICSDYTDEESCILAGCNWYDGACHKYAPVKCSDYKDALTCEANLCHWWAEDGTCHDTEEPTIGMIEYIECIAEKEAEGKYEISAEVTVKNLTDEDKRFYIALYDAVTDNHLGDEPDEFEPSERLIEAGKPKTFHIDTYNWPEASTTPSLRYDLWYAPIIGINKIADYRTEDCTEKAIGEILNISCTATKEAENEYEIEALVKFKNPDTISHLYKVELIDAETGDHKDWEPDPYQAGKEVAAGETSTIIVNTIGTTNCVSPKITIKLWETTGLKAVVDEQEKDCSEAEPTMFASLISFLMDSFNISESQAKLMVYGGGGLLALSFIMPMLRR